MPQLWYRLSSHHILCTVQLYALCQPGHWVLHCQMLPPPPPPHLKSVISLCKKDAWGEHLCLLATGWAETQSCSGRGAIRSQVGHVFCRTLSEKNWQEAELAKKEKNIYKDSPDGNPVFQKKNTAFKNKSINWIALCSSQLHHNAQKYLLN